MATAGRRNYLGICGGRIGVTAAQLFGMEVHSMSRTDEQHLAILIELGLLLFFLVVTVYIETRKDKYK